MRRSAAHPRRDRRGTPVGRAADALGAVGRGYRRRRRCRARASLVLAGIRAFVWWAGACRDADPRASYRVPARQVADVRRRTAEGCRVYREDEAESSWFRSPRYRTYLSRHLIKHGAGEEYKGPDGARHPTARAQPGVLRLRLGWRSRRREKNPENRTGRVQKRLGLVGPRMQGPARACVAAAARGAPPPAPTHRRTRTPL